MMCREIDNGRQFMGRFEHGDDLYEALTSFCQNNDIKLGRVEAIGAVEKACIKFYGQKEQEYKSKTIDQSLEILNITGNVSLMNGESMLHAHITLADSEGNAYGGHLAPGTIVFACEFIIQEFQMNFTRVEDEETGLMLWQL